VQAYNSARAYWVFCSKRLDSPGLILMTYEVKPNDQAALLQRGPPLVNAGAARARGIPAHLVLRCRGKSNNFTLGELAIVRFRLVCLSRIARITHALPGTKGHPDDDAVDVKGAGNRGIRLAVITAAYRVPQANYSKCSS